MLSTRRNRSIVFHLAALVLAAIVPFLGLTAYNIYDRAQVDTARSTAAVSRIAESTANETGRVLAQAQALLSLLAERPQIRALDSNRCDPLLPEIFRSFPLMANIGTLDASGRVVCSAMPVGTEKSVAPDYTLARTIQSRKFTVGNPTVGVVTKKWVVVLAMPIQDAGGEVRGIVAVVVDLLKFSRAVSTRSVPSSALSAIVDANGTFVMRSVDPEQWVGTQAPMLIADRYAFVDGRGTARVVGVDGVERIYGFAKIPGTSWSTAVGIPVKRVFSAVTLNAEISMVLVLTITVFGFVLSILLARRIAIPIQSIAEGARRAGAGDMNVRVESKGPTEIAGVAKEFNDMLAKRWSAENALRKSEEYFRSFVAELQVGVLVQTATAEIVYRNRAASELLGLSEHQILGRTSFDLDWNVIRADGTPLPASMHPVPLAIATGKPIRNVVMGVYRSATRDRIWLDVSATPVLNADNNLNQIICTFSDITEHQLAEERRREYARHLRRLLWRLMEQGENERRKLGRELHDRIGANLSGLLLSLGILRAKLFPELTSVLGPRISDCEALLQETMAHVKNILADIHPPALDELGLVAALGHLGRLIANRADLQFEMEGEEPSPRLPGNVEIALFRIAQEALNNAMKHAQASRLAVSLHSSAGQVVLTVEDDGKGFDLAAQEMSASGLGLMTMRERAEAIGATVVTTATLGKGTRITISLSAIWIPAAEPAG